MTALMSRKIFQTNQRCRWATAPNSPERGRGAPSSPRQSSARAHTGPAEGPVSATRGAC